MVRGRSRRRRREVAIGGEAVGELGERLVVGW